MLARLGSGLALAAVAALALVGCSPPEPVATTPAAEPTVEPSVSDEEVVSAAFSRFYAEVDRQFAAGEASSVELEAVASPSLARAMSAEIQSSLDDGYVSRGVLEVVEIEIVEGDGGSIQANLCTDGSGIETTDPQGIVTPAGGLVPWATSFEPSTSGAMVISRFDPITDPNEDKCDG